MIGVFVGQQIKRRAGSGLVHFFRNLVRFGLLMVVITPSFAVDTSIKRLSLTYSLDRHLCQEVGEMLTQGKVCRPYDALDRDNPKFCSPEEVNYITINGNQILAFSEIASGQYGYTKLSRSPATEASDSTIIYLERPHGGRSPSTVETWQVDSQALAAVLALSPGPIPYETWVNLNPRPREEVRAAELMAVLKHGNKVSDDWSPVITVQGKPYAVVRECSGSWFEGVYACGRINKITLKRLTSDRKSYSYCQFTRSRHQSQK